MLFFQISVYDLYPIVWDLEAKLKVYLSPFYKGDNYEGFSAKELLEWWVIINLIEMYPVSCDGSTMFSGSNKLSKLLSDFSPDRQKLLYSDIVLPAIADTDVQIKINHYVLLICFTKRNPS